jgi:hypothetical protein
LIFLKIFAIIYIGNEKKNLLHPFFKVPKQGGFEKVHLPYAGVVFNV